MVQRIVEELKCRGYNVWFGKSRAPLLPTPAVGSYAVVRFTDIEMMKGSVIECMSAAIEGAVGAEIQTRPVFSGLPAPVHRRWCCTECARLTKSQPTA